MAKRRTWEEAKASQRSNAEFRAAEQFGKEGVAKLHAGDLFVGKHPSSMTNGDLIFRVNQIMSDLSIRTDAVAAACERYRQCGIIDEERPCLEQFVLAYGNYRSVDTIPKDAIEMIAADGVEVGVEV